MLSVVKMCIRYILKKVFYDPNSVFYECPVCGQYEYSMENSTYEELDYNELAPFLFYMAVPPMGILLEAMLIVPGHIIPTEKPHMIQPIRPRIG